MKLAIEFARFNNDKGYGHIHKAGCRDLHDPETLGETDSFATARAPGLTFVPTT